MKYSIYLILMIFICLSHFAISQNFEKVYVDSIPKLNRWPNASNYSRVFTNHETIIRKYDNDSVVNEIRFPIWQHVTFLDSGYILVADDLELAHRGWYFYSDIFEEINHFTVYSDFTLGLSSTEGRFVSFASQPSFNDSSFNLTITSLRGDVLASKNFRENGFYIKKLRLINGSIILLLQSYSLIESSKVYKLIGFDRELKVLFSKQVSDVLHSYIEFSEEYNSVILMTREEVMSINLTDGKENWKHKRKSYKPQWDDKYTEYIVFVCGQNYLAIIAYDYPEKEHVGGEEREKVDVDLLLLNSRSGRLVYADKLNNSFKGYGVKRFSNSDSFFVSNGNIRIKYTLKNENNEN